MVLEVIYVVRHGYRSNWVVNPQTGSYTASHPTPTGIASDPALASYGVEQAGQLSQKIASLDPPVDVVYSSPFYRCLQTLKPTIEVLKARKQSLGDVRVENGISEFFGTARFTHPAPASLDVLQTHFPYLSHTHKPSIIPSKNGESLPTLHNRYAYALQKMISDLDHEIIEDTNGQQRAPRAALLCTHAAGMICIGRALTGHMPEDIDEPDFGCGTCALTVYVRRNHGAHGNQADDEDTKTDGTGETLSEFETWDPEQPDVVPKVDWIGKGVNGGWDCVVNGDCSFLVGGVERTWTFRMEQSHPDNFRRPSRRPNSVAPPAPVQAPPPSKDETPHPLSPVLSPNTSDANRPRSRSTLTTPLGLRATNSLPTPTPETITVLHDDPKDELKTWRETQAEGGAPEESRERRPSLREKLSEYGEGRAGTALASTAEEEEPI